MPPVAEVISIGSGHCCKRSSAPRRSSKRYRIMVPNRPMTQRAITKAVVQPITLIQSGSVNRPITRGLVANFIITTMIGAAITPLMTALQYSARMGSSGRKLMIVPIAVAAASVK